MEWLKDCEECFSIFEVNQSRRVAIAAMHMSGTVRSGYKLFMIGRTQAFISRFGEVQTEHVFDKFKKLQQTITVEM